MPKSPTIFVYVHFAAFPPSSLTISPPSFQTLICHPRLDLPRHPRLDRGSPPLHPPRHPRPDLPRHPRPDRVSPTLYPVFCTWVYFPATPECIHLPHKRLRVASLHPGVTANHTRVQNDILLFYAEAVEAVVGVGFSWAEGC